MKRRTKKKLAKRGNYSHYYDYYVENAKYEYLCRKFGKEAVDSFYTENVTADYKKNMQVEFLDNRGRYTSIQLFKGCYPSSIGTVNVTIQENTVSMSFPINLDLEGDV